LGIVCSDVCFPALPPARITFVRRLGPAENDRFHTLRLKDLIKESCANNRCTPRRTPNGEEKSAQSSAADKFVHMSARTGSLGTALFFKASVWFIINFQKSREVHFGNKECRSAGAMAPARLSLHYTARIAETRFPLAQQSPYLAPKNCCLLLGRPVLKLETSLLLTKFFVYRYKWAALGHQMEENLSAPLSPHFSSAARAPL
jgi:hypothetical protein